jgi:catechol 2,3-dioxygenase-like lactoylglutathione lyase family enzyme
VLASAEVVAFLATSEPAGSREFYERSLGLRLVADDEFALVFDAAGVQLRIQKVDRVDPHGRTALGWQVGDLDAAVDGLEAAGVSFERYGSLDQDARGIWSAPTGARIAWFKDPDGNVLSLIQP